MTITQSRPSPTTQREGEVCNADLESPQAEGGAERTRGATLHSAITVGSRAARWVRSEFTLPAVFSEQAPAVEEVRRYAREAAYAGPSGPMRAAGVAWCHLAATPTLVVSRVWAWTWQRPARLIVIAGTTKCLAEIPAVEWAVDNLIKPGAGFALWLFL